MRTAVNKFSPKNCYSSTASAIRLDNRDQPLIASSTAKGTKLTATKVAIKASEPMINCLELPNKA
jgi:hypothetical protein